MHQVSESGIATDWVKVWMALEELEDIRFLSVSLLKPVERLFFVAKAQVSIHKRTRRNVAHILAPVQFRKEPERIVTPTCMGIRADENACRCRTSRDGYCL